MVASSWIKWNCPRCGYANADNKDAASHVRCTSCGALFVWNEIDGQRTEQLIPAGVAKLAGGAMIVTSDTVLERMMLNKLKTDWLHDPVWDIELTEGFERWHSELLAFRLEQETRWEAARKREWGIKAAQLGCPGNLELAAYIIQLEDRIKRLESALAELKDK